MHCYCLGQGLGFIRVTLVVITEMVRRKRGWTWMWRIIGMDMECIIMMELQLQLEKVGLYSSIKDKDTMMITTMIIMMGQDLNFIRHIHVHPCIQMK